MGPPLNGDPRHNIAAGGLSADAATAATRLADEFGASLMALPDRSESDAPPIVELILQSARQHRASDIHLVPTATSLQMLWRIDGVLHPVAEFDPELGRRLIARLKVISSLLTYRGDVPQEGRVAAAHSSAEVRVSTFPTLHGEKAAMRLFAEQQTLMRIADLGFPQDVADALQQQIRQTSGVILLTGPSGSGKTTTAYACLREILAGSGSQRSIMTLEDPVEVAVAGTTQSQVRPRVGFDLAAGLKALMRQDPDVILVGEIRDPQTAEAVFQAALTGHLVITTFHAGSSAEAVGRLLELEIQPYLMRSTLRTILSQRLLRQRCSRCGSAMSSGASKKSADNSGAPGDLPAACTACGGAGYHGRLVLAEMLDLSRPQIARAILQRSDARELAAAAADAGLTTLADRAAAAVAAGVTDAAEVFRVFGRQLTDNSGH